MCPWRALNCIGPIQSDSGLSLLADTAFDGCPQLDLLCIPGGPGINAVMEDEVVLAFTRRQACNGHPDTRAREGAAALSSALAALLLAALPCAMR